MDNCTCTSRERVYIVYGNDFTIEAHVSVYDKDEGIYKLLDLTGVKGCQMRLVGTYRKAIGKDVAVSGSKVTAFFPGGSVGVGTYGVEITFVDSLGKGRIFERNLIGIVSASGEATVDNDIEGEAGEGLNVSVNVLTRTVRIGGVGSVLADYNLLENRPSIGGVTLEGNKRPSDLGMYSKEEADEKFQTKESAAEADKRVQGMLDGKVDKEPGKGLSANDLTDERAGKVDKLKMDGRANEYLNGAGTYSRPVRQGYGVSVADDNTVSVDPQVIARQSDVANVAADLAAQKAKEQGDIDRANAAISKEETDRKAAVAALQSLIDILNPGYQFMGVATPETNPGTPDQKVFYIANGKSTYPTFGGIEVSEDEVVILYYDTAWHKLLTGIASQAKLSELEKKINGKSLDATNLFIAGKYIDVRTLSIADDSTKSMTGVIRVKTGTKISINTSTPSIVSVITQCDENGNTIKCLLYGDGKGLHDYEYTIGFNGYIILSAHSFYHTCTITVASILDEKQDTLVSGENIKTINGKSLLGKGDINIKLYKNQPLRLYPNNKTMSAISFVFDDAGASNTQDDKVVELFKKYGLTCGFAYIAREDLIAAHKDEYLDYQKDGFQILSHSTDASTFPSETTQEDALNRLNTSLRRLENAGFVVNGFVAPNSIFDSSLYELPKKMYAYAFTNHIYPDINTRNANPCNLTRQTIQTGTVESIKTKIDTAISQGNILTLYGHSASFVDSVDTEQWCIARVEEIIQYCIAKRDLGLCYLGGVDDAVKYYYNL